MIARSQKKTGPAKSGASAAPHPAAAPLAQRATSVANPDWPPAFGLGSTLRQGAAAPSSVIQRLKVADKNTGKVYDTDDVGAFHTWMEELVAAKEWDRVRRLYQLLDQKENKDRNEAMMTSAVRRALDITAPSDKGGGASLLAELPREHWWKLFIEGKAHGKGHLGFDTEESPGYYGAMMKAFEQRLLPQSEVDKPMDFATYDQMHLAVTSGVLKNVSESGKKVFEPVPHEKSGTTWGGLGGSQTEFPMTRPDDAPSLDSIREMITDGELALEPESAKWLAQWVKDNPPGSNPRYLHRLLELVNTVKPSNPKETPTSLLRLEVSHGHVQHLVWTNYSQSSVEGKVNAIFTRYYRERDAAKQLEGEGVQRRAVLKAIVRTVRSLHVGHFFADANGRLNTMLLLNKLLMAEGLPPAMLPDTSIFGGEKSADQLVAALISGLEKFIAEVQQ